ncbi:hypothetical protein ACQ4PT_002821 [Festuca glaucescens]
MMSPRIQIPISIGGSRTMMSPKQLLTTILVVFSTLSFIKFLLITHSSAGASSSAHLHRAEWESGNGTAAKSDGLAAKEFALLRSVVAARAPCRLLVFGLSPAPRARRGQLRAGRRHRLHHRQRRGLGRRAPRARWPCRRLFVRRPPGEVPRRGRGGVGAAAARAGGGPGVRAADGDGAQVRVPAGADLAAAGGARRQVGRGRRRRAERGRTGGARPDGCHLHGRGTRPGGRRGGGGVVDVVVHDVDRTVERWYAREYLCEDNLVAAKGRLWHFRVGAGGQRDTFCSTAPVKIL